MNMSELVTGFAQPVSGVDHLSGPCRVDPEPKSRRVESSRQM